MPRYSRCALLCALPLAVASATASLAAQADSSPVARKPELRATVSLGREAYVLAYRRSAKIACAAGVANAMDAVLRDARATIAALPESERAQIDLSLDSAYLSLTRAGGCERLTRPTEFVVVDRFEGFAWNTGISTIGSPAKARSTADGYLVLARQTKLADGKAEATFTFTAARGSERLVKGEYRLPVDEGDCVFRWRSIETDISRRYPTLRALRVWRLPEGSDTTTWRAQCVAVRSAASESRWSTQYRNMDTDALEIAMTMKRTERGELFILVEYPGYMMR